MPECYPINSFGQTLNPRLNRGVSINRLSTGFPLNICGNDTLALVIPECSPLKLALECFNRVTCGDKHYRVSPQLSYPNAFIGYPYFLLDSHLLRAGMTIQVGFLIKLVPTCL